MRYHWVSLITTLTFQSVSGSPIDTRKNPTDAGLTPVY